MRNPDRSTSYYTTARAAAIEVAEKQEGITSLDVLNAVQWQIGFVGLTSKEIFGYTDLVIKDLVASGDLRWLQSYPGRPRGFVYVRGNVLDRIVAAIDQPIG